MRLFTPLIFVFLLSSPHLPAQSIDSLQKAVEHSAKTLDQINRDFERLRDSKQNTALQRHIDRNSQDIDAFLQQMREREKEKKQQTYIRIGLVTAFLIVLATGLARRHKLRKQS